MANKLAGQKAKFTKAWVRYQSTEDEAKKLNAERHMAEVLLEAKSSGFAEADVTSGKDIPGIVQRKLVEGGTASETSAEDPDELVRELEQLVDTSDLHREGSGGQVVYAYGYRCAPDRLKVGRSDGDVIRRIAAQITTSTPDRPALVLELHTPNCRALERLIHATLELRSRKIAGGGDEWFLTSRDEILTIFRQTRPT